MRPTPRIATLPLIAGAGGTQTRTDCPLTVALARRIVGTERRQVSSDYRKPAVLLLSLSGIGIIVRKPDAQGVRQVGTSCSSATRPGPRRPSRADRDETAASSDG
jgi:hypothetical protein